MSNIRFFLRREIDDNRWNELIASAKVSLPYAFSWYLDSVAENWGAFVLNNYEVAMPVVWLTKLGIKCLYQPYYCQQLGLFSKQAISAEMAANFLQAAKSKFAYIDINVNSSAEPLAKKFGLTEKKNLVLSLNLEYAKLKKAYSENHRRNIAKGQKAGLKCTEEMEIKGFQKFYLQNVNREKENFKPKHEKIFRKLTAELWNRKMAKVFAIRNSNNEVLAAALFIMHPGRLLGLINSSSTEGKKHGAAHFLFDAVIQKFAGNDLLLDFEGSSIASIARFYEGFGGKNEPFYRFKIHALSNISQRFK